MPVVIEETGQAGQGGSSMTVVDTAVTDGLALMVSIGSDDSNSAATVTAHAINGTVSTTRTAVVKDGASNPYFAGFCGYWKDAEFPSTGTIGNDISTLYGNDGVGFIELSDVDQTTPLGDEDFGVLKTSTTMPSHTIDANNGDLVVLTCSCTTAQTLSAPDAIGSDTWVQQFNVTGSGVIIGGSVDRGAMFTLELTQNLSAEAIEANVSAETANAISHIVVVKSESGGAGGTSIPTFMHYYNQRRA